MVKNNCVQRRTGRNVRQKDIKVGCKKCKQSGKQEEKKEKERKKCRLNKRKKKKKKNRLAGNLKKKERTELYFNK